MKVVRLNSDSWSRPESGQFSWPTVQNVFAQSTEFAAGFRSWQSGVELSIEVKCTLT